MPPPKRFEVRQIIPEHESVILFILRDPLGNYSTLPGVSRDTHKDIITHVKIICYSYPKKFSTLEFDLDVYAGGQV